MQSCPPLRAGLAFFVLCCGCKGNDELTGQVVELRQLVDTSAGRLKRAQSSLSAAEGQLLDNRDRLARVPGRLDLEVPFQVGDQPLELETLYESDAGEIEYKSLRYWLSNVSLVGVEGQQVDLPDTYFLMEHTTTPRDRDEEPVVYIPKRRELIELRDVPAGEYVRIAFDVGVDKLHNEDLSLPGGELNVLSNMATSKWMWFTSYIFSAMWIKVAPPEGAGAATDAEHPQVSVSWETGGTEDLRRVELALPEPVRVGIDLHPKVRVPLDAAQLTHDMGDTIVRDSQENPSYPGSFIGPAQDDLQQKLATNWQEAFTRQPVTVAQ